MISPSMNLLHKPHPQKTLKNYQIVDLEKELKAKGHIR